MTLFASLITALGALSGAIFVWQMVNGRLSEAALITALLCTPLGAGLLIGMQFA